jgi:non-specific serine/threonine protein kinase
LRLRWEHVLEVQPLEIPNPALPAEPLSLATNAAVALFLERAQMVEHSFGLTASNAAAVADLCVRLDGLPLAIELAAARVGVLTPSAISTRLSHPLDLLTGGARDQDPRHRALRSTLAWSYDLLAPEEQSLFRRLAVFVGGVSIGSIEAVTGRAGVLDGLSSLVSKSLVRRDTTDDDEPRFSLLETIRELAREKLEEAGEADKTRHDHAEHFLGAARDKEPEELVGPERGLALEWIEQEYGNLLAALGWLQASGQAEQAFLLGGTLWRFWWVRGRYAEGRQQLDRLLDIPPDAVKPRSRGRVLAGAGELARMQGDYTTARARHEETVGIYQGLDDQRGGAVALRNVGLVAIFQGDYAAARAALEQCLEFCRALQDRAGTAMALNILGEAFDWAGDHKRALALSIESLAIRREIGDRWAIASSVNNIANATLSSGNPSSAAELYRECLNIWAEFGDRWRIAYVLDGLAGVAAITGQPERALRLAGAAAGIRDAIGSPYAHPFQQRVERWLDPARRRLTEPLLSSSRAAGYTLTLEQAIAYALTDEPLTLRPTASAARGLTAREFEVAHLVADGLTNRLIADRLVVSERTVDTHVDRIRNKLGVRSRAQIAVWLQRFSTESTAGDEK